MSPQVSPLDVSMSSLLSLMSFPDGSRVEAKTPDGTRVATPSNNPALPGATALAAPAGPSGAATPRTASYAGAVKAPATDWHLEFSLNGKRLQLHDTIYGVVHQQQAALPEGAMSGGPFASSISLTWKKVDGPAPAGTSPQFTFPLCWDDEALIDKTSCRSTFGCTFAGVRSQCYGHWPRCLCADHQDHPTSPGRT